MTHRHLDSGHKRSSLGRVLRAAVAVGSVLGVVTAAWSAPPGLLWENVFDPEGLDDYGQYALVADGRSFAAAVASGAGTAYDFVVRAHDSASGALLWSDQVDRIGAGDAAFWLAASGGRLAAAGFTAGDATCSWIDSGNCDFYVRAYDAATGAVLWEDRADGGGGTDWAASVAAGAGRVVAAGERGASGGHSDLWVRAYNAATGALLWEDVVDRGGGDDGARSVAIRGSLVLVAGMAGGDASCDVNAGTGDCDFNVRAYDAATGSLLWEDLADVAGAFDWALDVAVRGNLVVATGVGGAAATCNVRAFTGDCDLLVRAYMAQGGGLLWEDRVDYGGHFDAGGAITLSGNTVAVAGSGGSSDQDLLVRAYRAHTGALLWQDQVDGSGMADFGWDLAAAGSALYVAGSLQSASTGHDPIVRAYDLNGGSLLWEHMADVAGGLDLFFAVDADGGVVSAAGYQTNTGGGFDILVRTYGTGGHRNEVLTSRGGRKPPAEHGSRKPLPR